MRRIRRFVLVVVIVALAAYGIWGWVESRRLARAIAEVAARGEPTGVDDRPPETLTGEQRDAALAYAAAADRLQEDTRDDAFRYLVLDVDNPAGAVAAGPLSDLEARYRKDAPALQLLDQAGSLDFAAFGDVAHALERHQYQLTSLNALNALRADLLSMRGRGDEACDRLAASVRLQRTLSKSWARHQASSRLLGSVRILLRHTAPVEASLVKLQRTVDALPDTDTLADEMLRARADFIDGLARPAATPGEAVTDWLLRPLIIVVSRRQLGIFSHALALTRAPWPAKFDLVTAFEDTYFADMRNTAGHSLLGWVLLHRSGGGFSGTSVHAAAHALTVRRVASTVLAVERYRRANREAPPPSLDALLPTYLAAVPIDPFSGEPLVYTAGPAEYRIYSVDSNRKDDGGALYGIGSRAQLMPRPGAPSDLGILVPRHPAK